MNNVRAKITIVVFLLLAFASDAVLSAQSKLSWYKGNTHAHTLNSDGDSTPDDVVKWYRENG